jgi:hypothetical protein
MRRLLDRHALTIAKVSAFLVWTLIVAFAGVSWGNYPLRTARVYFIAHEKDAKNWNVTIMAPACDNPWNATIPKNNWVHIGCSQGYEDWSIVYDGTDDSWMK